MSSLYAGPRLDVKSPFQKTSREPAKHDDERAGERRPAQRAAIGDRITPDP